MSFSYKAIQPISSYPTQEHNKGGFCEGKRFVQLQCVALVGRDAQYLALAEIGRSSIYSGR